MTASPPPSECLELPLSCYMVVGVLTINMGNPEVPVGKSNGLRHSVWEELVYLAAVFWMSRKRCVTSKTAVRETREESENMGDMRQCNFLTPLSLFS